MRETRAIFYILESVQSVITDVNDALDECDENLDEIAKQDNTLPEAVGCFSCSRDEENDKVSLKVTATSLPSSLTMKSTLSEKQEQTLEKKLAVSVSH